MQVLYFAWVRQRIGVEQETIDLPESIETVAQFLDWLRERGQGYAHALKDLSIIRVAVNQDYVGRDHRLNPDDEVALFPPVTGG